MFWKRKKQPKTEEGQELTLKVLKGSGFPKSHPYHSPVAAENLQAVVKGTNNELQIRQTEAVCVIAEALSGISSFLNGGGIQEYLKASTKGQIVSGIYNGLASKDGRNSLDARTIKQNALEIVEVIEAVMKKVDERANERNGRDEEIKEVIE